MSAKGQRAGKSSNGKLKARPSLSSGLVQTPWPSPVSEVSPSVSHKLGDTAWLPLSLPLQALFPGLVTQPSVWGLALPPPLSRACTPAAVGVDLEFSGPLSLE